MCSESEPYAQPTGKKASRPVSGCQRIQRFPGDKSPEKERTKEERSTEAINEVRIIIRYKCRNSKKEAIAKELGRQGKL
jgi:hypothetical protein